MGRTARAADFKGVVHGSIARLVENPNSSIAMLKWFFSRAPRRCKVGAHSVWFCSSQPYTSDHMCTLRSNG